MEGGCRNEKRPGGGKGERNRNARWLKRKRRKALKSGKFVYGATKGWFKIHAFTISISIYVYININLAFFLLDSLTSIFSISLPHECHSLFPQSSRIPWRTHTLTCTHSARYVFITSSSTRESAVCVYRNDIGLTRADQRLTVRRTPLSHQDYFVFTLIMWRHGYTARPTTRPAEATERRRAPPSSPEAAATAHMARPLGAAEQSPVVSPRILFVAVARDGRRVAASCSGVIRLFRAT